MAIEIREIVIRANITQPMQPNDTAALDEQLRKKLVAETTRAVIAQLNKRSKR
ncbi:MAG: DUF5908 family protein [Bacteroidia bacterium]|jgi:phenylpyruvate tautomerase PptA (4-oxalocrotonate tautomerase family)|nr:DUF5908 family protein [Bacteroidia bacterium]